ncbi:MAG: 5-(carboxyamino)imidazole ribonucleotide synthase [Methyloligellaceae bacterium]
MADFPLSPGSTVGILGGGQLGRMLALAAAQIGLHVHIYAPEKESPAFDVSGFQTVAQYNDLKALEEFAGAVDVATIEFENIPLDSYETVGQIVPIAPNAHALSVAQDRLAEKAAINAINIETAAYAPVTSVAELSKAVEIMGTPAILKTCRFGYDGKGQSKIEATSDLNQTFKDLASDHLILEAFVPFDREISVIVVRDRNQMTAAYAPAENVHENHILKTSTVPATLSDEVQDQAKAIACQIAEELDYIGILGVEMFHVTDAGEDRLLVNEIAPRVHNSGHWTLDACAVSQFENHIRAIAGWPLGPADRHSDAEMTNLIGNEANNWPEYARQEASGLHLYGKNEIRAGRKMGHVTRLFPKTNR